MGKGKRRKQAKDGNGNGNGKEAAAAGSGSSNAGDVATAPVGTPAAQQAPRLPFSSLAGWQEGGGSVVTVECSVVTGMEEAALKEAQQKLHLDEGKVHRVQGRILFDLEREQLDKVLKLRTVDNVWLMLGAWKAVPEVETDGKEGALKRFIGMLDDLQWRKVLEAWARVRGFQGEIFLGDAEKKKKKKLAETEPLLPSFRCTCYRSGEQHAFSSMDAAREVGGAINDRFGWKVQMKASDLDVVLTIDTTQVYFSLALNQESLFKRNIEHFGPTTLRATICSALLQFANIQPGDIVVDPLCGGGSIPIEGAAAYSQGFHIGGDMHELAYARAGENVASYDKKIAKRNLGIDILRWDATRIPLKQSSVDVFVTDLPFGKRSGSKADNRVLYPQILISMAKAVRPLSGRAVILTQDKSSMFKCFGKITPYWKMNRYSYANIGGLAALVFFMTRTSKIPEDVAIEGKTAAGPDATKTTCDPVQ